MDLPHVCSWSLDVHTQAYHCCSQCSFSSGGSKLELTLESIAQRNSLAIWTQGTKAFNSAHVQHMPKVDKLI